MQKPRNDATEKGITLVGAISSAERGELLTAINSTNANGAVLPPFFCFSTRQIQRIFLRGALHDSVGATTRTGWMNKEIFLQNLHVN